MYIQGKETDDMILDVVKALWERHKRKRLITHRSTNRSTSEIIQ